ncbi:MAG: tetratricopeptide repeat protein [Gemmatimonadetes bacterium]|nr:tetratricopeptide repeat protein [Gemmatimonadota bacterium]NIR77152.1 tetratricopeptide repeat protein [Gemmatimonadota bacterium]NIT87221.1 tetratricopeptide repeat protein [Gemmatimonadota bacterium]NIU31064.1 tetratricopeptide repeat protein [Gemmatimonadota bacterium]NIU35800.1 tetratricopeptide repeat protein [Gemmatimonadota bacterium]
MRVRFGLVLAASLTLVGGACATGGGGGGGDQGIEPRDNEHTNAAQLFLTQAQTADDSEAAQGYYRQALERARVSVQTDSLNPRGYYQAGIAAVQLGEYSLADSMLTEAVELYPGYQADVSQVREQGWINLYNAAIEPMNRGNMEEALRLFEAANQLYAGRPEAFLNAGSIHSQMGNPDEAAEAFRAALDVIRGDRIEQVDSATAASWRENEQIAVFNLGQALAQAGRYQAAIEAYDAYLERNPEDVAAISNLAVILVQAEMPDSAMAIYEDLLQRPDLTSREYFSAGVGLYQVERYDMAADAFDSALEMTPRARDPLFNLVQAHFAGENWQQVVETTERLLDLDPYNGNTYKMRAKALVETGDQQAAGRVIEDYQALPFEIGGLRLTATTGGGRIEGVLTNRNLSQGTPIQMRIHFLGADGTELGTESVTVQAPAQDDTTSFASRISSDQEVSGYWYEVVSP